MRTTIVVTLAAASVACRPPQPRPSQGPDVSTVSTADQLPNARLRLRLHVQAASLPERDLEQTIWLRGSRFRVADAAGRAAFEVLGDVTSPGGLGLPATTMEEIMDRRDAARRAPYGVTELYGDLATDAGVVAPAVGPAYATSAAELAPIARQVLAQLDDPRLASLARAGDVTRLGRAAIEYRGEVETEEHGVKGRNTVVRVVAPPYLLLDDARNALLPARHYYVREVVAIDEGVVTDADVTPPSLPPTR